METNNGKSYGDYLREQISALESKRFDLSLEIEENEAHLKKWEEFERQRTGVVGIVQQTKPTKRIKIPEKYWNYLSADEKLLCVINMVGEGYIKDFADKLQELDPSYDKERAGKLARQRVSYLKLNGYLDFKELGFRKTVYSIKPEIKNLSEERLIIQEQIG